MELTEDQVFKKYGTLCKHCNRNCLLPYVFEFTRIACGYNVIEQAHELGKISREKMDFINRIKNAEQQMLCICIDVKQSYESDYFDKIFEVLSKMKKN